MKYILYRGYILKDLGEGANVEIYRSAYSETQGLYIDVPESEVMAMFRVDREITEGTEGMATWADVDGLNRLELGKLIEAAHADSRREKEKYERSLMTPLEFAKAKAKIWAQVSYDIESKG